MTIHVGSQVESVAGYIGNYEVSIRLKEGETLEEKVGCIVVAVGAVPLEPKGLYGYDGKTIITQAELEEQLKRGAFKANNVVMIQCVGARCPDRR